MVDEKEPEQSFTNHIREQLAQEDEAGKQRIMEELRSIAAGGVEVVSLNEGGIIQAFIALAGALFAFYFATHYAEQGFQTIGAYILFGLGVVFVLYWFFRRKSSVIVLSPTGVTLQYMDEEIPWTSIKSYSASSFGMPITTSTSVFISLVEGAQPPRISRRCLRVQFVRRKNTIAVRVIKFAGLSTKKVNTLFGNYFQAGHARAALFAIQRSK